MRNMTESVQFASAWPRQFQDQRCGPTAVRHLHSNWVQQRGKSVRQAAIESGVSFTTISRIERGQPCDLPSILGLCD